MIDIDDPTLDEHGRCKCNVRAEKRKSEPLLTRLENYCASMAPHQRERMGGKLLLEAMEHIRTEQKDVDRFKWIVDKMDASMLIDLPEDLGQAREYIDELMK